ncbi:hypothetical protein PM10SUCC1_22990 [Propionigenium maris DSM 9537]|uniref:Glycosyltransferase 2-like domain-containing protein n=1 Tax=Propionigenium maris DSM 9537 TaxID=1123000 RepID=A0A9W6GMC7_9FUSO|nr:glycosyltransferase [Propionigenium maris]GLI56785.1 hypothetical protein PM10SUCC1_22990 [Propionigenium maris DSM 9537]
MVIDIEKRLREISKLKEKLNPAHRVDDSNNNYTAGEINKGNYDIKFLETISDISEKIPQSNGSRYYKKLDIKVGIIADEFLYNSYKEIAEFVYITPENYKDKIPDIDLLLVVSAWKGLNDEWVGLTQKAPDKRNVLFKIIEKCKKNKIKTVFYSKEDPVNYERFIEIAKKCEYVFTSAKEKIEDYKKECGHENVDVLTFGINPIYHNPIGLRNFNFEKKVVFSGSWIAEKYPERGPETIDIFDGILRADHGLKIIDRNFNLNLKKYKFPEQYTEFVSPAINHEKLQKVHKLYNWAINLNSIKDSFSMFANRVYELQAMGNILLSNYSIGVNCLFPNVFIVNDGSEVQRILNGFNEKELYRHQVLGIRNTMSGHCNFDKLQRLFSIAKKNYEFTPPLVTILYDKLTESIQESYKRQTYENKELVSIEDFSMNQYEKSDIICYFSEEYLYEEFYIQDMVNGFKYTDSDYITKDMYYEGDKLVEGIQNNYVSYIKDEARTLYWKNSFTYEAFKKRKIVGKVGNGYSIDPFEIEAINERVGKIKKDYKLSLIIPTYNNGDHLWSKCFNSLKRSTMFNDIEIIIVDDGSTDNYTPKIVERLGRHYANVKTYFYNDGGSGSASRPRNKGIELSTTELITYLDPDNEAVNDGYYKLYKKMLSTNSDIVIGDYLKLTNKKSLFSVKHFYQKDINSPRDYLLKTNFRAQSIQALIVKKEIITKNSLEMIEGAIGQDTLFFQELILNSKNIIFIDELIHLYYAAVEGSAVNNISRKFFERYLIMEKGRLEALESYGLLKSYKEQKFEYYYKNWYLEKLKKIKPDDYLYAKKVLLEIFNLYSTSGKIKDEEIRKFVKS